MTDSTQHVARPSNLVRAFQTPYLTVAIIWVLTTALIIACIFGLPPAVLDRSFAEIAGGFLGAAILATLTLLIIG